MKNAEALMFAIIGGIVATGLVMIIFMLSTPSVSRTENQLDRVPVTIRNGPATEQDRITWAMISMAQVSQYADERGRNLRKWYRDQRGDDRNRLQVDFVAWNIRLDESFIEANTLADRRDAGELREKDIWAIERMTERFWTLIAQADMLAGQNLSDE